MVVVLEVSASDHAKYYAENDCVRVQVNRGYIAIPMHASSVYMVW